jgi:membrane protein YdbS with pleckstrin-like domain
VIQLWIQLARRYLLLPEGDPAIPGNPKTSQTWNPDEKYLHYSLLNFYIGAFILGPIGLSLLIVSVVLVPLISEEEHIVLALLVGAGVMAVGTLLLFSVALNFACVHLELDMLRYTLTDQALRLRRGVMKVEEVTLSYVNIQNVQYSQGPLQRFFGIADLLVETAGGGAVVNPQQGAQQFGHRGLIKGVSDPETLRDLILARVQAAKGAGLGDDSSDDLPGSVGSVDTSEGRALLTEIRDALKTVNQQVRKT